MTPEQRIERRLVAQVEKAGGVSYKVKWPGTPGAPDRLVLFPGHTCWVELKSSRGKLRKAQVDAIERLRKAHSMVYVLASETDVDHFVSLFNTRSQA
jgi:hypothetical protein